jgi:hypothetical protein
MQVTMTCNSDTLVLALATLGGMTTNRKDPISVVPPKVARASTSMSLLHVIVTCIIVLTFTNVNMA